MKAFYIWAFLMTFSTGVFAQELFPISRPASTLPKGVWQTKLLVEHYKDRQENRYMSAFRVGYGLLSNWSVSLTLSGSNHHGRHLEDNLLTHTHSRAVPASRYPFLLSGINAYTQYRFFSQDSQNEHFRMAWYGEVSTSYSAHDESEPRLIDDTAGVGSGLIFTWLKQRFATSLTVGGVMPFRYTENRKGVKTEIVYGNALNYNLSFGYLFSPKVYKNYTQTNFNLYLELLGKSFTPAQVFQNDQLAVPQTILLGRGNYIEAYTSFQFIFQSNTRLDISLGVDFIKRAYIHIPPIFMVGIQHYFYQKQKNNEVAKKLAFLQ